MEKDLQTQPEANSLEIEEKYKLSPEALEITNAYLSTMSIDQTAQALQIPRNEVVDFLNKKEVKRFIDTVFFEQGYLNRFKLQSVLEDVMVKKLEEMEEAEMASSKDIVDIVMAMHKIRQDELKISEARNKENVPGSQTNVQVNNYGENYGGLISKLIGES